MIDIQTLGGFQVRNGQNLIDAFDSDKVRLLLAYLAVEPAQPYRRETIAALFWPESNHKEAAANLRWALSNLRKIIGDRDTDQPFLLVTRQSIQRNPDLACGCDALDFLTLSQPKAPLAQLGRAADLYRGEFMAGIHPKNSLPLDEWLLLKRENLARTLVGVLQRLIANHMRRAEFQLAIPYARRWVELEPWQEQSHRQLMRLLAASGQRNAALAQYQTCRTLIYETLGVEPEQETTRLYEQICASETAPVRSSRHNLEKLLPPLVGRSSELRTLQSWLQETRVNAILLIGPGGVGKTHLAIETAKNQIENFADGAYFVDLRALETRHSIIPAIAEAIHFSFTSGRNLQNQLVDYLEDKQILLILDNFEHLQDQTGVVVHLLGRAARLKILLTSRVRLNIPGARSYPLAGLDLPNQADGELESSAVRLFLETAARIRPGFEPGLGDLAAIGEVCRLVEGLPLGILLAAAWMDILPPAEIAAAIRQSLDALKTGWDGVADQHRSIRIVLGSSWNMLDESARQTLASLSVFRGDFSRQAAQAVSRASLAVLQHLMSQSLLNWAATGRLHLHELLRQFAAEHLEAAPETNLAAHDRHAAFYLAMLARQVVELKGPESGRALAELGQEAANHRLAWDWAVQRGFIEPILRVVNGFCYYLSLRVRFSEGQFLCRNTLAALATGADLAPDGLRLKAQLLAWLGYFSRRLGDYAAADEALMAAQDQVDRLRRAGDESQFEQGLVCYLRGQAAESQDRLAARRFYEQSLACFTQIADVWEQGQALSALGAAAWNLGEYETAARYHRRALALRQSIGDARGIATSGMSLGMTLLHQGYFDRAEALISEGSCLRREIGDRLGIADSLRNLGFARMMQGNFEEAAALLNDGVEIYLNLGLRYGLEMTMLASAWGHRGDFEQAHQWCQQGLAAARTTRYPRALGYGLLVQGELALAESDYGMAQESLAECERIYQNIGQDEELCRARIGQALLELKMGEPGRCETILRGVRDTLLENRAFIPLFYYVFVKGLYFARRQETSKAEHWLDPLGSYPLMNRSRWFARLAEGVRLKWRDLPPPAPPPEFLWRLVEQE